MRATVLFVFGLYCSDVLLGSILFGAERIITYDDLRNKDTIVIGALGIPLGTVFEVEGTIVLARDTLPVGALYYSNYLLNVDRVNGVKLTKPVIMWYNSPGEATGVIMPASEIEAAQLKGMKTPLKLTEKEERNLNSDYVGKRYKIKVLEYGYFDGVPEKLPEELANYWFGPKYSFSTRLGVLAGGKVRVDANSK